KPSGRLFINARTLLPKRSRCMIDGEQDKRIEVFGALRKGRDANDATADHPAQLGMENAHPELPLRGARFELVEGTRTAHEEADTYRANRNPIDRAIASIAKDLREDALRLPAKLFDRANEERAAVRASDKSKG